MGMQVILSIVLFVMVLLLNMLPLQYVLLILLALVLLAGIIIWMQRSPKARRVGLTVSVLFSALFLVGSIYIGKTYSVIQNLTAGQLGGTRESKVSIIVLQNSTATGLEDLASQRFGIQETIDRENTDLTLQDISMKLGTQLNHARVPKHSGANGGAVFRRD